MGSSAGSVLSIAAPVAAGLLVATGFGAPLGVALGASADIAGAVGGAAIGAAGGALGSVAGGKFSLGETALGGVTGGVGGYVQQAGGLSNALGIGSSTTDANTAVDLTNGAGPTGQAIDASQGFNNGTLAGGQSIDAQTGFDNATPLGDGSSGTIGANGLPLGDGSSGSIGATGGSASIAPGAATNGFAGALNPSAINLAGSTAPTGFSSYLPSVLGGTGSNPSSTSLLAAGANLYSGIQGTAAAKANTAAEQQANNAALALQTQNYNATTANLSPYLTTGNEANQQLQTDLGLGSNTSAAGYGSLTAPFTLQSLQNTPGYQFQLQQGTQALNQSLGAQGQLFSGAAIKEGQDFASGLADSTYNQAYSNYLAGNQQTYNQLAGTSGSGQNAATNQGGFAAGLSSIGTPTLQNTGNITAAGNNAGNTAVNNSLAGALYGGVGGAQGSSYGTGTSGMTPLAGGGYSMNGMIFNAQGVRTQ